MIEPGDRADVAVTAWIQDLKRADPQAAEHIWRAYFDKLVRLAKRRMGDLPRRIADEEDVALSALNSVILGIQEQRFPDLDDREDLWKLLVVVTTRKATAHQRRHFADKRPDHRVCTEFESAGREPTPEFAAQFAEEVQRLLAVLPGEDFRRVALLRLEGYTNREIAERMDWYEVKVERRLRIIRKQWAAEWECSDEIAPNP